MENYLLIIIATKKQHLQHKDKHKNTKKSYTDGLKSIGKEIGFAAIFVDINRREVLHEEFSIHTSQNDSNKENPQRDDKRWLIYTLSKFNAIH